MCGWSIDRELQSGHLLALGTYPGAPRDIVTLVHTVSGQPCSRLAADVASVRQPARIT
jgi:hypothetical protein